MSWKKCNHFAIRYSLLIYKTLQLYYAFSFNYVVFWGRGYLIIINYIVLLILNIHSIVIFHIKYYLFLIYMYFVLKKLSLFFTKESSFLKFSKKMPKSGFEHRTFDFTIKRSNGAYTGRAGLKCRHVYRSIVPKGLMYQR